MSFKSLLEIAARLYDEASSAGGPLPQWHLLGARENPKAAMPIDAELREQRVDGSVPNCELFKQGFNQLAKLVRKADRDKPDVPKYAICNLSDPQSVQLEVARAGAEGGVGTISVLRADLLADWCIWSEEK